MAIENTLEKVNQSALALLEPMSLEKTLSVIVREATQILEIKYGTIFLVRGGKLVETYRNIGDLSHISPRKNGFTEQAFKTKKVFVIPIKDLKKAHPDLESLKIKTSIFLPLTYRHQTLGVLNLHSTKNEDFTKDDIAYLQLFSSMSTLAIRKAELYTETKNALATRDEFMALSTHELKTPLTAIIGYLQLLCRHAENLDETQKKWLEQANISTKRLSDLVSGLLEANQVRAGKLEILLEEANLAEIIDQTIKDFEKKFPERKLVQEFAPQGSWLVIADPRQLKKALLNLLENSVKFSKTTSVIKLRIKATSTKWNISVIDHGQGMSAEDKQKIQQGFHKANSHTQQGLGIGLFLSNSIILAHRGSLKIVSKVGKGTTITICLPRIEL